jgi:hypothetical protein
VVVSGLIGIGVAGAVDFDGDLCLWTVEIKNEGRSGVAA